MVHTTGLKSHVRVCKYIFLFAEYVVNLQSRYSSDVTDCKKKPLMCLEIASTPITSQPGVKIQFCPPPKHFARSWPGRRLCQSEPCGHCSTNRKKSHHRREWILWPTIRLWFHQSERHRDLLQRWRGVWTPMWLAAFCPQGKYAFVLFDFKSQNFPPARLWNITANFVECQQWAGGTFCDLGSVIVLYTK